ncbi:MULTISPECIES: bifunctional 2-methylcitrate synthase/citrate synthase [Vibrio]|uniref:Citrate synthase n=3 Tax=Vibrio harveyi group TaxID=717610 RepID=A0A0N8HPN6_VIBAL|nr:MULTISPECIES: 2-methylcitrate synthase [Vibrio]EEZ81839.1 2-methylcitrate synthase [Vibrio alginolyticus 40B]MDG2788870.1 2-methylcitrate synthase [Vibrio parahaemolyticus]MDW1810119.1 2-methylcitrate synthase [Vibrio sp. Vb2362]MDW2260612.1 2-methylcitrate synthase [Vibrio sp. 1409]MDW2296462.1 2-methylcitrate synthase [Vibrio sp. 1404]NAW53631.1 2-methylcitrate synthase [Vibrio sp. V41_P2S12T139]NAW94286.1 2-methylcitrate synthase [Vibrio sp. V42_P2S4T144]QCO86161.1 2-methylcitrate syn
MSQTAEKKAELGGAGLRGQSAGSTALCTVGKTGTGLTYRGYDITDLANNAQFEEVAHLLLRGHLPNQQELDAYKTHLLSLRGLPAELKQALELIPASAHPMDVMRTGCSVLGNLEQEMSFEEQLKATERMLALFPAIICYWYRFSHDGVRINTEDQTEDCIGGYFLRLLTDKAPSALHKQVMHCSLILYAEHEFNASTFAARVCASTLSDIHSCITAAIGTLRGPLHGGANEAAMEMIEDWQTPDEAEANIMKMLANKDKIMGFGHAIYRESDPRNALIKRWSKELSKQVGDTHLYAVSERVESVMKREKGLFCNADFFHASAYHFMDIPTKLFTPIFVMSRLTGWAAHVYEQRANNRIIRPSADYTGPDHQEWVPIENR